MSDEPIPQTEQHVLRSGRVFSLVDLGDAEAERPTSYQEEVPSVAESSDHPPPQLDEANFMEQVNVHLYQFKEQLINELTLEMRDVLRPVHHFMSQVHQLPNVSSTAPASTGHEPSRDHVSNNNPAPKKVGPFDGSAELESYLIQFNIIATANGWDEEARATALSSALSGPALALLSDVSPPRTYRRLVEALEERYGTKNQAQMFLTLLNTRAQKAEEDIKQFHQAIRSLARNSVSDVERHGVYHFSRGLRDAEVRRAIDTLSPATMSEALVVALRVEAALQRDRTYRGINLRIAESLEMGHNVLQSGNQCPFVGVQHDPAPSTDNLYQVLRQQPVRQWSGPRTNPQVACWRCDGLGHYCRDCPTWRINKQNPVTPQGNDRRSN
ncbi:hypothetical protein GE061_006792 [Apolygus lucorum]|uniref:Uncharacterized protein n=1 Tax=Apolygus lucorum TaxID=248454 RepID=A0A6A4IYJ3_APOLU|nr:hypothetical protein GE061_006792 [Apolygus lucorum]